MSRSGYSDDGDCSDLAMWRGRVMSAIRGKRGQRFFRDLLAALDAMPTKRLIANDFQTPDGEVCTLGCLGRAKGIDLSGLNAEAMVVDYDFGPLRDAFDIAEPLAQEVMYVNDEEGTKPSRYQGGRWVQDEETPEERWTRVRKWAARQIRVREDELLPADSQP